MVSWGSKLVGMAIHAMETELYKADFVASEIREIFDERSKSTQPRKLFGPK
jgi:hypothetical protein